ncbi:hypothetical protein HLB44_22070 [Aquincola sp. S2]|uniref:Uncharacterized protein n=1 Tax=Pseudaquabacterium terrae TaxID=2732868 RepID=A0ABX2EM08_9BURK|nr:hypothetical protein [Aquabacterium terrae]NRF69696.1 hypothetical protein [Aquabacterium terrae]
MATSIHRAAVLAGAAFALAPLAPALAFESVFSAVAGDVMRLAQAELNDTQAFMAAELEAERPVRGAPYCADAVHESVQLLPDANGAIGNRIVRRQQTRLCRDGEGRTRQEVDNQGQRRIYLRDPVGRENWVLDPQRKTARKLGRGPMGAFEGPLIDHSAWHEYGERMREWARGVSERMSRGHGAPGAAPPAVPPLPPVPQVAPLAAPAPVVIAAGEPGAQGLQMRVLRADHAGGAELPLPPGMAWRASGLAPRGPAVVTALGSKDIDGVRAGGERSTWTIEAGKVGNEKPIHILREVWRSPDLLLTLSTTDFDPRSGETRYRLTNLKRGEPDPVLMQVPADYTRRGHGAPTPPTAPTAPSTPRGRG